MKEIIRAILKSSSGYVPVNEAYRDKLILDRESIKYVYEPVVESELNVSRKWAYRTTSPIFRKLFAEAARAVEEILARDEEPFALDIGTYSFTVTYADKTRAAREFYLSGDEFKECFAIVKQMVPGCEYTPAVLLTSEDYGEEE